MLSLDIKKTVSVSFETPLRQYVKLQYPIDPESLRDDYLQLDQLRNSVQNAFVDETSRFVYSKYYHQLIQLVHQFPLSGGSSKVTFPWYPTFGGKKLVTSNDMRYEIACVLYNCAALYSQLASTQERTTGDSLKKASTFYQNAAGILKYLREYLASTSFVPPSPDLHIPVVVSFQDMMVAQAQACFYDKAVLDKMKDATLSKLAQQTHLYFDEAYRHMTSPTTQAVFDRNWQSRVQSLYLLYSSRAQFHKAKELSAASKMGEAIARLQLAQQTLGRALEPEKLLPSGLVTEIKAFQSILNEETKKTEMDNDLIYHNTILEPVMLSTLPGISMVQAHVPVEITDASMASPFLFDQLMPFSLHRIATNYVNARDAHVQSQLGRLNNATLLLQQALDSMRLPQSIEMLQQTAASTSTTVPRRIVEINREIQQQSIGGAVVKGVKGLSDSLSSLFLTGDTEFQLIQQCDGMLNDMELEDDQYKAQYQYQWLIPSARSLTAQLHSDIATYRGMIQSAQKANETIKTKIEEQYNDLEFVSQNVHEIISLMPLSNMDEATYREIMQSDTLRSLINELSHVNQLFEKRSRLTESLHQTAQADTIEAKLLLNPNENVDENEIFPLELEKYKVFIEQIDQSLEEQKILTARIISLNEQFKAMKVKNRCLDEMETFFERLEASGAVFTEIVNNLQEGYKFFSDIHGVILQIQNQCQQLLFTRKQEIQPLLNQLSSHRSSALPSQPTAAFMYPSSQTGSSIPVSYHTAGPSSWTSPSSAQMPPIRYNDQPPQVVSARYNPNPYGSYSAATGQHQVRPSSTSGSASYRPASGYSQ